ncbi:DUF3619 family protein [Vandammella animalimorsus]|uniref:DUF3619 family protein n=1 Tax=Vandammella animalimorsus TaxID=2029117 RepID=A0A2A2ALJ7_9BURK|nr:DUF3619 family protein [Vandammella animalimorsus]PAT38594.1 hypothetical protein CK625_03780 [Vandammella animalimorsus]
MNTHNQTAPRAATDLSAAQAQRLGIALGKALRQAEHAQPMGHDIGQRLRIARQQAMAAHQLALLRQQQASTVTSQPAPRRAMAWWKKTLALLPLAAAGAGVMFTQGAVSNDGGAEMAQTDTHILSHELPPSALSDPGFQQFLKNQRIAPPASAPQQGNQ